MAIGELHNQECKTGPLSGLRDIFLGVCQRCKKRTYVASVDLLTPGTQDKEKSKKTEQRCAFCVWRFVGKFAYRERRPEDSPLFIGHRPVILDARGVPFRQGEVTTGKASTRQATTRQVSHAV